MLRLLEGEVNFIGDLILYIWRCDRTGHIKFRIKKQNMCSLNELLTDLDNANESVAIDAQNSLEIRGEEAIKPVLSLLPSLGLYGQCCALDLLISWPIVLLQSADNPSTSDVLIPLLLSQNPYIRESSAFILGKVGAKEAIPAIEQALKKVKAEGIPLDYSEPVAYRNILTKLGARTQIIPYPMAMKQKPFGNDGFCWSSTLLVECIELLSSANQVLLYYQAWKENGESYYWQETPHYELDLTAPWNDIVIRSAELAIATTSKWVPLENKVVTLEWIGQNDL